MDESSVVEIWKTCAYNPNAGQWILRNIYASQIYDLSKEVDDIIRCAEDISDNQYVKSDIDRLASLIESCKDIFSRFLEGQLCSDVTVHDVIKAYDRLAVGIEDIRNFREELDKLSDATYIPTFIREGVSA